MANKNAPTAKDMSRKAMAEVDRQTTAAKKSNPFWDLVNLAEEVRLPKPHLTQSDLVAQIERGMAGMDAAGRVSAYRQVLAGVVEGRFSQYAVLPFGHFAVTEVDDKEADAPARTRNRTPEARRLMAVIDAIIAEMPEGSSHRQLNAKYADASASVRGEDGKVDESRLTDLILAADKAGEPFWTDSREFIRNGAVSESSLSLADLAVAGVLSITKTESGGVKVFVAGGSHLPPAIDRLAEAGFENASKLLRERTQRRTTKIGSSLAALAGLGAKTSSDSESEEEDETDES